MEIFKNFLTLIFPNRCPFCKKVISKKEYSCEKCKKDFPEISYRTVTLNAFQNVSPFPYSNQYRKAVLNFKFHQKKYYYRSLGYYTSLTVAKEYGDKEFDRS
ncbi:MAG: double zinc ribbon domain-containing protein, partial [Acutalibacteraceae bacterium]